MSSNPIRLKALLQKYLDNACSRQELKEFWQLMSELSEEDRIGPELRDLWDAGEKKTDPARVTDPAGATDPDKLFGRLQQKMAEQEIDYSKILAGRPRRLVQFAVAASLLGCILLSWWLIVGRSRPPAPAPAYQWAAGRSAGHQVINLPDGTVVTLNHDSKLNYPASFNGKTREVYLDGEAFFNVKEDAGKVFLVHTGSLVTKVLGTSFNIKAYGGDENIAVTVTTGKVQVQRSDGKRPLGILLPGDQLLVGKHTDSVLLNVVLVKVDLQKVLDWKEEDLLFDNSTFDEAAVLIGNHYGVELRFKNEAIRNCRFTGNFNNDSLGHVMNIIGELTQTKWARGQDNLIWIEGEGCK